MKKTYITGAAILVLLSIVAADYYFTNDPSNDQENPGLNKVRDTDTNPESDAAPLNNTGKQTSKTATDFTSAKKAHKLNVPVTMFAASSQGVNNIAAVLPEKPQLPKIDAQKEIHVVKMETPHAFYAHFANETAPNYQRKPGDICFGIEGGVNMSGFYNNNSSNMMKNSYHAGPILDIYLGNHFALQPGLMYYTQGSQSVNTVTNSTSDITTTNNVSLHYLQLPVNLVYKAGSWGRARFIVGAGPYVSYLLNTKTTETINYNGTGNNAASRNDASGSGSTSGGNEDVPGQPQSGLTDNFRKLDIGAGCFIGCELPKGFYAKAGGQAGFLNVEQSADGAYNSRNYSFQVSIGQLIGK